MRALATAAWVVAGVLAGLRWLRVAQAEHYLPGAATRFSYRWWWGSGPENRMFVIAAKVGAIPAYLDSPVGALTGAAALTVGPIGLGLKGRTSQLAWTRRMRTLAGVWLVLEAAVVGAGAAAGWTLGAAALAALLAPVLVDVACWITAPLERRLAAKWVTMAADKLARAHPIVVAITGSYGKTTTKAYVAHLVGPSRSVMATPRSFNNRAGLARSVNEHFAPGTEVFVAEMGTYGPGEIADMCAWVQPSVAVITAIGPVHLERFGSEDRIVAAKSEILATARTAVLNVDDPRLAALADAAAARGQKVYRCSAVDAAADVAVLDEGVQRVVMVAGRRIAEVAPDDAMAPTNIACAVGAALGAGIDVDAIGRALPTLPTPEHRLAARPHQSTGATLLDDTFNSNPAGAARALAALAQAAPKGRKVVVTPGMVELGHRQHEENAAFAMAAVRMGAALVVVGRTNRRALVDGATRAGAEVVLVDDRDAAVRWVGQHVIPGDAVLYENDLPDIYP